MKKLNLTLSIVIALSMLLAACASATPTQAPLPTQAPVPTTAPAPTKAPAPTTAPSGGDELSAILARGTLVLSTDPAYPPQSQLAEGGKRAANTKCASDQHTASELTGFDIDTAVEIAKRLGVEACFVTPDWTLIVSGNWADRWDMSVGSVSITPERMEKLYFSEPYYTTPAAFFVHKDNTTFKQPSDLSGKKIGACTGCTYDSYLLGKLVIPGEKIDFVVQNPQFTGYDTDTSALQDLALGDGTRLDAVLTAQPTGQGSIKGGLPLKQLGDTVFFEYLAAAFDKSASKDPIPFAKKVTEIIQAMHADGTLLKFSQKYYGTDLTTAATKFDFNALKQW
jgi:polar amino acid transport system substrate-binding protein